MTRAKIWACHWSGFVSACGIAPSCSYRAFADGISAKDLRACSAKLEPTFSGRIRYTAKFTHDAGSLAIDLGAVGQSARLWCNGVDLGVRVCPPYRYDLTAALWEGENTLVIEVSNTLANAVRDNFSAYMAIPASGLVGPIRWMREA
jgi:hypothetical protein